MHIESHTPRKKEKKKAVPQNVSDYITKFTWKSPSFIHGDEPLLVERYIVPKSKHKR